MSEEKRPYEHLPTDVYPVNYKLELQPDLSTFTFEGRLEITVKVSALLCLCKLNVNVALVSHDRF